MFYEKLLSTHYTEVELEMMYMGTEWEARKTFQRTNSFNRRRQLFDRDKYLFLVVHSVRDVLQDVD